MYGVIVAAVLLLAGSATAETIAIIGSGEVAGALGPEFAHRRFVRFSPATHAVTRNAMIV